MEMISEDAEDEKEIEEDDFITHPSQYQALNREALLDLVNERTFQRTVFDDLKSTPSILKEGFAMDAGIQQVKATFSISQQQIPNAELGWYSSQGFIGYQTCALLAQHWLIDKACTMPSRDAIRKGYDLTINDGSKIEPEIMDAIRKGDVKYGLNEHLVQFVRKCRVFGIRIAMFKMRNVSDDYYQKPFNLDGVKPGMYEGIVQIDPYWITPILDAAAAADPASLYFYEPTWWQVNGVQIHRTHLIIIKTDEVTDILQPTYFYGGVPVPQKIFQRVYAAERTADEAPQLALTKRSTIFHTDLAQAISKQAEFESKMAWWAQFRDNYGIKIVGEKDAVEQFDTSLADLDAVIMTQFQLVAAAANVPATKLLGTSPKGFNATGEFEEASYHEELESIQTHDMTPLIERHHAIMIRSDIVPTQGIEPFETTIIWKPLDSMTALETATVQKMKADTGLVLVQSGAISPSDERKRIIDDPDSGYSGIEDLESQNEMLEDPDLIDGDPLSG